MTPTRYPEFCPVARAAELLAERWTLLILRNLFTGPQRFSDLRRGLPGISPSVLAGRLEELERQGIIRPRTLPPPAASRVYELAEAGLALGPALTELARWGLRFLFPARPGEGLDPATLALALGTLVRRGPTPAAAVEIRIAPPDGSAEELRLVVRGGPEGARAGGPGSDPDASVRGDAVTLLAWITGALDLDGARSQGLELAGDLGAAEALPAFFDTVVPGPAPSEPGPRVFPNPQPVSRSPR